MFIEKLPRGKVPKAASDPLREFLSSELPEFWIDWSLQIPLNQDGVKDVEIVSHPSWTWPGLNWTARLWISHRGNNLSTHILFNVC